MEFGWNSESDSIVHLEIGISMAGGSRGHRNTSFGYLQPVPKDYGGKQITSCDCRVRQGEQSSFHQKTSKTSYVDKQTGKYTRTTNKKVVSTGETFKERSTGRVGYKDEYKTTSTYRVGDKCGYTEHQLEEKIRRVDYGGSSGNKKGKKSAGSYKKYVNLYFPYVWSYISVLFRLCVWCSFIYVLFFIELTVPLICSSEFKYYFLRVLLRVIQNTSKKVSYSYIKELKPVTTKFSLEISTFPME